MLPNNKKTARVACLTLPAASRIGIPLLSEVHAESCGIIAPSAAAPHEAQWKADWRAAFTKVSELLDFLAINPDDALGAEANAQFPLRVPRSFAQRMRPGDLNDPLLRQVLSRQIEQEITAGFSSDPVGDLAQLAVPGLIHKYAGRALLITTGSCAVHCRYCFRREFPYATESLTPAALNAALHYLRGDPSITELILSGGDPFALDTTKLQKLSNAFAELPQLRRLRIHTRTPIVLPSRVDTSLCAWLRALPWPCALVLHVNHAQELAAADVGSALAQLKATGVCLLNQAVLLKAVNDSVAAQVALSEALYAHGVLPYYLNQLDQVQGAAHFAVDDALAIALHAQLRAQLPGYLVPKLVRDVRGGLAKTPL